MQHLCCWALVQKFGSGGRSKLDPRVARPWGAPQDEADKIWWNSLQFQVEHKQLVERCWKNIKLCRFLRERKSQGFNLHYSTILYPLMTMKGELRSAAASLYKQASGRHWEAHIMSIAAAVRAPRGHSSASDVNILRLACFWWPSRDSRAVFKSRQILTHLYFKWRESCLESIRESIQLKTGFRVAQVRPLAC